MICRVRGFRDARFVSFLFVNCIFAFELQMAGVGIEMKSIPAVAIRIYIVFQPVRVLRLWRSHLLRIRRRLRIILGAVLAIFVSILGTGDKALARAIIAAAALLGKSW